MRKRTRFVRGRRSWVARSLILRRRHGFLLRTSHSDPPSLRLRVTIKIACKSAPPKITKIPLRTNINHHQTQQQRTKSLSTQSHSSMLTKTLGCFRYSIPLRRITDPNYRTRFAIPAPPTRTAAAVTSAASAAVCGCRSYSPPSDPRSSSPRRLDRKKLQAFYSNEGKYIERISTWVFSKWEL